MLLSIELTVANYRTWNITKGVHLAIVMVQNKTENYTIAMHESMDSRVEKVVQSYLDTSTSKSRPCSEGVLERVDVHILHRTLSIQAILLICYFTFYMHK